MKNIQLSFFAASPTDSKSSAPRTWNVYSDGASRGNPGPAGAGCLIMAPHLKKPIELYAFLGDKTNNQAEYVALLLGAQYLSGHIAPHDTVTFYADSQLVINQMNGTYKIKDPTLKKIKIRIDELLCEHTQCIFRHITRDKNTKADKLANKGITTQKPAPASIQKLLAVVPPHRR